MNNNRSLLFTVLASLTVILGMGVNDIVELETDLNGRGSVNFYLNTPNVKFTLQKGTHGKVEQVRKLKSGNYGFYIKILDGNKQGESAWVYHNLKTPTLKLYQSDPQNNKQQKKSPSRKKSETEQQVTPEEAKYLETLSEIVALKDKTEPKKTSKIDVASAIACNQALEEIGSPQTGYPKGYFAVPAQLVKDSQKTSGALLFFASQAGSTLNVHAKYFVNLQYNQEQAGFPEFFVPKTGAQKNSNDPKAMALQPEKGQDYLTDESRAILSNYTFKTLIDYFKYFSKSNVEKKDTKENLPALSRDRFSKALEICASVKDEDGTEDIKNMAVKMKTFVDDPRLLADMQKEAPAPAAAVPPAQPAAPAPTR